MFKKTIAVMILSCLSLCIWASEITFSGGFTEVSLKDNDKRVRLSGTANVSTQDIDLKADTVELYGQDYCYVSCKGNVLVRENSKNLDVKCTDLFYDRTSGNLMSDGWIEINDSGNEAKLSGGWLDYNTNDNRMKIQIQASIEKSTDDGLLSCTADSISYDAGNQTLELKGNASVRWGSDNYRASLIQVDINSKSINLHGSITGEVNGR